MHSFLANLRFWLLKDGIFLILLVLADKAWIESFVTFHVSFPFCFPLFPRGTFPHLGGVQFRFTGLKQPYIVVFHHLATSVCALSFSAPAVPVSGALFHRR